MYIYIYIYIYICVCVYIYIYIYIQEYTFARTSPSLSFPLSDLSLVFHALYLPAACLSCIRSTVGMTDGKRQGCVSWLGIRWSNESA
jgi:hypothetical protein